MQSRQVLRNQAQRSEHNHKDRHRLQCRGLQERTTSANTTNWSTSPRRGHACTDAGCEMVEHRHLVSLYQARQQRRLQGLRSRHLQGPMVLERTRQDKEADDIEWQALHQGACQSSECCCDLHRRVYADSEGNIPANVCGQEAGIYWLIATNVPGGEAFISSSPSTSSTPSNIQNAIIVSMKTAQEVMDALSSHASDSDALFLQRFFKTSKGQYGEGDVFIGVRVPATRMVCRAFYDLSLQETQKLFDSPVHEHRLAAAILLVEKYKRQPNARNNIYDMYLRNVYAGRVNNWDIVDLSAEKIIGPQLVDQSKDLLFELAASKDLWQRRVAVLTTFYYIKNGQADTTLALAELLLHDTHDLMHKAVGWMLREIGKRVDEAILIDFLDAHAHEMPRTMLRYAIEKLPPHQRAYYLAYKGTVQ